MIIKLLAAHANKNIETESTLRRVLTIIARMRRAEKCLFSTSEDIQSIFEDLFLL